MESAAVVVAVAVSFDVELQFEDVALLATTTVVVVESALSQVTQVEVWPSWGFFELAVKGVVVSVVPVAWPGC